MSYKLLFATLSATILGFGISTEAIASEPTLCGDRITCISATRLVTSVEAKHESQKEQSIFEVIYLQEQDELYAVLCEPVFDGSNRGHAGPCGTR